MGSILMLFAEILVAVLLVATVITSVRLSRRIAKLQADEQAMRKTILELMSATETAERAIAGLRNTLGDCEKTLADRLRTAERYSSDLAEQVEAGEQVMTRMMSIVDNGRGLQGADVEQARPRAHVALPAQPAQTPISRIEPEPAPRPMPQYHAQSAPVPVPPISHTRRIPDRISDAAELLARRAMDRLEHRGDAA